MLEGLTPKPQIATCKVKGTAAQLSESDSKIFTDAIANPAWSGKALSAALKERGVLISDTTIIRHRKKECSCY